jgi:hypothetical protein
MLKLPLTVDLEQKVCDITSFHNFLTYNRSFRKWYCCTEKNVVMVTLTTGIMFLLFTCMHSWV